MKGIWAVAAYLTSWGWANLELRWCLNWALNGEESGDGVEQGNPQSLQKQQKRSVWGAGRIIGFNRKLHILSL